MRISQKKIGQFNIWPGFVDILATLLIVTIFTIMISGIAQVYFNEIIGKNKNEISKLDVTINDLSKKLSLELDKNKSLISFNDTLSLNLKNSKNEILELETSLKKSKLLTKIGEEKIFSLREKNENLVKDITNRNKDLQEKNIFITEKEEDLIKKTKFINKLEKNLNELKKQLITLSTQLNEAEMEDKKNKVEIKNLGKKLNSALAGKVQELSQYQSLFFKEVKNSLGERDDVIISDDRFIFPSEIFFISASDELETNGIAELRKIAISLNQISKIIPKEIDWVLRIDGHTDKIPIYNNNFASNWHLSSSRAIRIVNYLIDEGIPPNRLIAAGFGEFHPLIDKNTEDAYQKNRRIEIKLTNR